MKTFIRKCGLIHLAGIALLCLLLTCFHVTLDAQDVEATDVQDSVLINQIIETSLVPTSVTALVERKLGKVSAYPAKALPAIPSAGMETKLLVGAAIPPETEEKGNTISSFSFVLKGQENKFMGTPVVKYPSSRKGEDSLAPIELERESEELLQQTIAVKKQNELLETKLNKLRENASQIAGVSAIVDLKMELEGLRFFGREKEAELERLRKLVELARNLPNPPNVDALRHSLSEDLKEAAQATAMADRLHERKKRAAVSAFREKLRIVKELEEVDTRTLAREALRLRNKRRDLEKQLNITPLNEEEDF